MRRLLSIVLIAFLAAGVQPAAAQVPTPEQMELLRSMSPEDREALMEQLGLGSGASGSLGSTDSSNPRKRDSRRPGGTDTADQQFDASGFLVGDKTLKPDDTVLLSLDFPKAKPPRIETPMAGMPPVTIPGEPAPEFEPVERDRLTVIINLVSAANPYQLDKNGMLTLPGFSPFMLAGLDETQAAQRIAAVPSLRRLDVKLTRLPVRKTGVAGLRPYGYDLFKDAATTFAPVTDVPVPSDYVVGPGDQLNVQLYGSQNRSLRLVVGRDGRINVPGMGPINVAGQTFDRVSTDLEQRVAAQMIGTRASVGMGDTRSIRVFVMGEANRPGSYTVSGLATITSALYASGGVKTIGSLRNVQLKRQGAVVRRLDLYDLLLRGDTSDDAKLLPGDVIFVPAVTTTVAIDGEVNRPAIYELNDNTTVADLVALAGGVTSEADSRRVALVRVDEQNARVVLDVPLNASGGRSTPLRNGDSLRVLRLRPTLDSGVTLEGHVFRPGPVGWRDGLRLTDVIGSIDELRPSADINYVLIRRELPPDRRIVVVSADLAAALREPASAKNIPLQPRDRIVVFDTGSGRRQLLDPLLGELRLQARIESPTPIVRIEGRVNAAGEYPLEPQMRVSDLLRAGGGLQDAAFGGNAELTRYRLSGAARQTDLVDIDLAAIMRGDSSADLPLRPFDFLNVKEIPEWSEQEQVTLIGEVRFPGRYPINRGETLRSVLNRAGGLSSLAFPDGAVFTRVELLEREQQQLDRLAERLQSDLASAALMGAQANQAGAGQALAVGQSLLTQLKDTRAVGRLVINLNEAIEAAPGSSRDVALRDGDVLRIPKLTQEVTVIGEVQNSTSHFYRETLTRDDYIALSGGLTRKADDDRIYVVRANGSVVSSEGSGWFRRSAQIAMRPGDTVVAPLDTERMPALPMWQAVTQILYNLAIAAAAVNSF